MVRGEDPETCAGGDLILCAVFLVQVAPVANNVAVQECCWGLSGTLQRFQGSWRGDNHAEVESSRCDDGLPCLRETLTELLSLGSARIATEIPGS